MPTTTPPAPPNFYEQAGKMGAAQAGGGAAAGAGQPQSQPSGQPDPTQDFLAMTDKLLQILSKMEAMKPGGKDISKFMQAAAQSVQQAVQFASGDQTTGPGDGTAGDQSGAVAGAGAAGAAIPGPVGGSGSAVS